jgi:heme/copper-type cytochrome/quinol oxidase subunit 3
MGAIATLRDVQRLIPTPVTNTDSLTLSSAAYHAAHAMATMNGRWGLTGFMTFSSLAFALGVMMVAAPMLRRRAA